MCSIIHKNNIAVILAGGCGAGFGSELPKQFLHLTGKTVIEHTVDAFERNNHIDEISIVAHPDFFETVKRIIINEKHPKVKKVLEGGKSV
jgi:2-C-methyl-D-erythritol 4-phosphate cytidylyltransferase